jgi:peptidyl-prolyl cis-trans isomerase C
MVKSEVSVNGVAVDVEGYPTPEAAAARELLRQEAVREGLVAAGADAAADEAGIERLLDEAVHVPEPSPDECRRYYDAHPREFESGALVAARHILFQMTDGTPLAALRARAEGALAELRAAPERFESRAREWSNCPSGREGGHLGQLQRGDMVPEFESVLFHGTWTGIAAALVRTRFGFHIVSVDQRIEAKQVPFEAVQTRIAERLRAGVLERALAQYVRVLAGRADVRGVDLAGTATPLVQ